MTTQDNVIADFMSLDEPMVTFRFQDGSGFKMMRKVLVQNSDVFKTMLSEEKWAEGSKMEIMIEDSTFSGSDTMSTDYKIFISAMCGRNIGDDKLDTSTLINVYAIAHKYQVDKVMKSTLEDIQRVFDTGLNYFEQPFELLLRLLSTFEIDINMRGIYSTISLYDIDVLIEVCSIAQKYEFEVIQLIITHTLVSKIPKKIITCPAELKLLLQFISTHKFPGLDAFNLGITKDNYLEFFDVIKHCESQRAKEQFARFVIDNKIPYQSWSSDLGELLFEVYKLIISDQDSTIRELRDELSNYRGNE